MIGIMGANEFPEKRIIIFFKISFCRILWTTFSSINFFISILRCNAKLQLNYEMTWIYNGKLSRIVYFIHRPKKRHNQQLPWMDIFLKNFPWLAVLFLVQRIL